MKSTVMALWQLTVTLGNVLVSAISLTRLPAVSSFWLFAALGLGGALLFGLRAYFYQPRDYVQE
jgi:hypothetical protein